MNGKSLGVLVFILIIIIIIVIACTWSDKKRSCDKKDDCEKKCEYGETQRDQIKEMLSKRQQTAFGSGKAESKFLSTYGSNVKTGETLAEDPFHNAEIKF